MKQSENRVKENRTGIRSTHTGKKLANYVQHSILAAKRDNNKFLY